MTSLITKTASAAVLALLLCGAAQAQQAPAASSPSDWRVFGAANITFGGDTMETFTVGGKSDKIKAGESFQIALGAEYAINPDWAVSASIGYHFDSGSGSDGEISFDRIPVEILAHYNATPQFKLGAGFRSAGGAKLTTSGVADTWLGVNRGDYKSSAGLILEGEYFLNPNRKMSLVARFVQEDFTHKASGTKYDGNHFGIGFKAYF